MRIRWNLRELSAAKVGIRQLKISFVGVWHVPMGSAMQK